MRAAAVGVAVVALTGAGLLGAPPGAWLGAPGAEVWGHVALLGAHAAALPGWPAAPTALVVDAAPWPVMDPLPTAAAAVLARVIGVGPAWNLLHLAAAALAAVGGARLARAHGGDAAVGAAVLGAWPALQGAMASGLSEDLWVGLVACALAAVQERRWARGGLLLGLAAWTGLVVAWMGALAAVVLGLARAARRPRDLLRLAGAGLLAGLIALPAALAHADRLSGQPGGAPPEGPEALWRLNPWRGADLASFVVPGPQSPGDALLRLHPAYLGAAVLVLAARGRARAAAAVLALALALAPGLRPMLAGAPLGIDGPAAALRGVLPGLDAMHHHGRFVLLAGLALTVLAARGARAWSRRRPRLAAALPWLLLADLRLGSPLGPLVPTTDARPPTIAAAAAALPPGALLHLPLAGPGVHFQRPLAFSAVHGRPLYLDPHQPGLPAALRPSRRAQALARLAGPGPLPPDGGDDLPPALRVVLVEEPWVDRAAARLGPPTRRDPSGALWLRGPAAPAKESP